MTTAKLSLDALRVTVANCPLIDNHAHNLLTWSEQGKHSLESITSEAQGAALEDTVHSLAHIRAVKQLSEFYGCRAVWDDIKHARASELEKGGQDLIRRSLAGTHTILIDDGLDPEGVFPHDWHSQFTTGLTKRIVRIEYVAQQILADCARIVRLEQPVLPPQDLSHELCEETLNDFLSEYENAISASWEDNEVAGFKSVVCYRTGLSIQNLNLSSDKSALRARFMPSFRKVLGAAILSQEYRIEEKSLNDALVVFTLNLLENLATLQDKPRKKPLQFHTGLGDSDINLGLSNPAHLQPLIEKFPNYPIVLLHSAYPYTREAGYLATVFKNVLLDIGEVFPALSRQGQESVLRQSLELVPTNKILWSTDGHWFPETYYLANLQFREALDKVLVQGVREGDFTVDGAIRITEKILFENSNHLYHLGLELPKYERNISGKSLLRSNGSRAVSKSDFFQHFMSNNPDTELIRVHWIDNLSIVRIRLLPVTRFAEQLKDGKRVNITLAATGLLPGDNLSSCTSSTGQMRLEPDMTSLRPNVQTPSHASVMCSWLGSDGSPIEHCSRSCLDRMIQWARADHDTSFLIGFEIEFVLFEHSSGEADLQLVKGTHSWSTYHPNQRPFMRLLEGIVAGLAKVGVGVEQFHAEGAHGQYEIVLSPLPPIQAIDALVFARQTIKEAAAAENLHATFVPYPIDDTLGTGAHAHLSLTQSGLDVRFFSGVLRHLPALQAFCMPQKMSYKRVSDSTWGSGSWVGYGTQNREVPLRRIERGHWEIRCLDGTANMYLAFAGIIAAGLIGLERGSGVQFKDCPYDPAKLSVTERAQYGITSNLTDNVAWSLTELAYDQDLKQTLGETLVDTYLVVKREEQQMLDNLSEKDRKKWLIERF